MTETFYRKNGRRYVPVAAWDAELLAALPVGAHLVFVRPGLRITKVDVAPAHATVLAAVETAREAMVEAMREAGALRPADTRLSPAAAEAWAALSRAMGESRYALSRESLQGVVDAGARVLEQAAAEAKTDSFTASEWQRLRDWMADPARPPAILAFASGPSRDAATAFESALRHGKARSDA